MEWFSNPKILGSLVLGFALVSGTYVVSNFGDVRGQGVTSQVAIAAQPVNRVFIEVNDANENGVEDWREELIRTPVIEPLDLGRLVDEDYQGPGTLTERFGVDLMEGYFASLMGGPLVRSREQVITDSVRNLESLALQDKIYDVRDIIVSSDLSPEYIRIYANQLALILIENNGERADHELFHLSEYIERGDESHLKKLAQISAAYQTYRDQTIKLPVPRNLVKTHLDLINVYHAMAVNIEAMANSDLDPMNPYLRLRRYRDDLLGLEVAMQNLFLSLSDYANLFRLEDPAMYFANYAPD